MKKFKRKDASDEGLLQHTSFELKSFVYKRSYIKSLVLSRSFFRDFLPGFVLVIGRPLGNARKLSRESFHGGVAQACTGEALSAEPGNGQGPNKRWVVVGLLPGRARRVESGWVLKREVWLGLRSGLSAATPGTGTTCKLPRRRAAAGGVSGPGQPVPGSPGEG